ncbi:tyrosine-type recombinase/integrase [Bengtsoniella intestinalis]|uniref:tyrosine-type recombinase/integrase n=1 Tax=Bengtsoniella intestinalis TaxID=3073143 RepID=UPI00391EF4B9
MTTIFNLESLTQYEAYLHEEERSPNTIQKYCHDISVFLVFSNTQELSKLLVLSFKEHLLSRYAPASVNSMLAAVNGFLTWLGFPQYKVKPLKIQRDIFSKPEKELTQREYQRLIATAEQRQNRKLSLVIQTICSTGIRVSELQHITVSTTHTGRTSVTCKGKIRTIFLPKELCRNLKHFCKAQGIHTGSIFLSKSGKPLDRSNIWRMMKSLCKDANVEPSKVFPHNLRHLFARTYYKIEKDISRLADILGHSSINTTRIYTIETGRKHARQMDKMNLAYWMP